MMRPRLRLRVSVRRGPLRELDSRVERAVGWHNMAEMSVSLAAQRSHLRAEDLDALRSRGGDPFDSRWAHRTDAFVIHFPSSAKQHAVDAAVAKSWMRLGQVTHLLDQPRLVGRHTAPSALRRAVLPDQATGLPLGELAPVHGHGHGTPSLNRAQKFPSATSRRTRTSKACSATSFLSATFSRSSSFRRFISGPFMPPY